MVAHMLQGHTTSMCVSISNSGQQANSSILMLNVGCWGKENMHDCASGDPPGTLHPYDFTVLGMLYRTIWFGD